MARKISHLLNTLRRRCAEFAGDPNSDGWAKEHAITSALEDAQRIARLRKEPANSIWTRAEAKDLLKQSPDQLRGLAWKRLEALHRGEMVGTLDAETVARTKNLHDTFVKVFPESWSGTSGKHPAPPYG